MRAEIPASVPVLHAKATAISTGETYQRVTLSDGADISARLVVLANGLNKGLRRTLGIEHRIVSECHSVTIGFDLAPIGRQHFPFRALTYYPERPSRPDGLSDAVSDRRCHARQSDGVPRASTIPGCSNCAAPRKTRCIN